MKNSTINSLFTSLLMIFGVAVLTVSLFKSGDVKFKCSLEWQGKHYLEVCRVK